MRILITGAAGNLGSLLARHLLPTPHELRLLIHRAELPSGLAAHPKAAAFRADLAEPATLPAACRGIDAIVHFAGLLFAPGPEAFLPRTNLGYVKNLVAAAKAAGVGKFILVSFPHVEGETTPEHPARERLDAEPDSVHARTRLAAERHLFEACDAPGTPGPPGGMRPLALRCGMIYARGVKMIDAARWLAARRLLAVWPEPTWEHLISLPDFLAGTAAAIEKRGLSGIVNLCDDRPVTLQDFLDRACDQWGYPRPKRLPRFLFPLAGRTCETFARLLGTVSPLTRDFIRIGMSSSVADNSRMHSEILPKLAYPTLDEGISLL